MNNDLIFQCVAGFNGFADVAKTKTVCVTSNFSDLWQHFNQNHLETLSRQYPDTLLKTDYLPCNLNIWQNGKIIGNITIDYNTAQQPLKGSVHHITVIKDNNILDGCAFANYKTLQHKLVEMIDIYFKDVIE